MIYVLHFDPPLKHARHYVGFAVSKRTLAARIAHHMNGTGAIIVKRALESGCSVSHVATFEGDRIRERRIKDNANGAAVCPLCRAAYLARKRDHERKRRARTKGSPKYAESRERPIPGPNSPVRAFSSRDTSRIDPHPETTPAGRAAWFVTPG